MKVSHLCRNGVIVWNFPKNEEDIEVAAKAKKKEISMEEALWKSADKLRGSVEPSEYKHVVLSLFFLKFASDKFEAQRARIIADGMEKFADNIAFYTKDNVFYLPQESRWAYIMENAKQDDIALKIDTALFTIEKTNPIIPAYRLIRLNWRRCWMKSIRLTLQRIKRMILSAVCTNIS